MVISKRQKKVLVFFHTNQMGGAEKSAIEIIKDLQKNDFEVKVVLPDKGELTEVLTALSIPVLYINYYWWCSDKWPSFSIKFRWALQSFLSILKFKSQHANEIPDIIITNTITIPWGMLFSRLVGKPHIMLAREFGNLDFGFKFLFGYTFSLKIINWFSDYVFTNSQTTLAHYKQHIDPSKIDYFYPLVTIDSDIQDSTQKFFKHHSYFKILHLGTITSSKGQLDAVRAVLILLQKGYTNIELLLAGSKGSGEYFKKILEIINSVPNSSEKITIVDFVAKPLDLINQADVVLVCSKNEAFGRVTVESMEMAKPLIATNSGANTELLKDGIDALLYTAENETDLANKIELLYKNPSLAQKLGAQASNSFSTLIQPKMKLDALYKVMDMLVVPS